eukprot:1156816-Pelagomonas_calceolata.AAC.1
METAKLPLPTEAKKENYAGQSAACMESSLTSKLARVSPKVLRWLGGKTHMELLLGNDAQWSSLNKVIKLNTRVKAALLATRVYTGGLGCLGSTGKVSPGEI